MLLSTYAAVRKLKFKVTTKLLKNKSANMYQWLREFAVLLNELLDEFADISLQEWTDLVL